MRRQNGLNMVFRMSVGMPKPENKRTIDKRFTARLLGRSECLCTRVLLRLEFQVAHPILMRTLATDRK